MGLLNIFKRKKEAEKYDFPPMEETITQEDDFTPAFDHPSFSKDANSDLHQLILTKLDLINQRLEVIDRRLQAIEELAQK